MDEIIPEHDAARAGKSSSHAPLQLPSSFRHCARALRASHLMTRLLSCGYPISDIVGLVLNAQLLYAIIVASLLWHYHRVLSRSRRSTEVNRELLARAIFCMANSLRPSLSCSTISTVISSRRRRINHQRIARVGACNMPSTWWSDKDNYRVDIGCC